MKALRNVGGKVVLKDVPRPEPAEGQVLVRIQRSAISAGTELFQLGRATPDTDAPMGYIATGVIEQVRADGCPLQPGDRVFAMCGHAEYGVKDAEKVFALPPELDLEQAVASYWAVPAIRGIQRLAPRVYDDVAVVGQGPIGLMALQILRHWAGRLVAVDVNPLRLAKSAQLGADLCVNPLQQDLVGEVSKLLPEGPQRVLEASGTREGLRSALEIVRPRGLVATLRIAADLSGLAMEHYVYRKDLRIVASGAPGMAPPRQYLAEARPLLSATAADVWPDAWHFSRQIRASLEMLRRGYIQAEPVISHRVRYDQVLDIYRQLCDRSQPPSLIGVVINWE